MRTHTEINFENDIVAALQSSGWLVGHSSDYDRKRALYPEDVEGYLKETQPEMWNRCTPDEVFAELAELLDSDGPLALLREEFQVGSAVFKMCEFAPATTENPLTVEHHSKVRCRVVRQLRYSLHNTNTIDLVLFVNGIPVATAELKTDFTQSIELAIEQYKKDRLPRNSKGEEPLLAFNRRALVHFAVSTSQVFTTTHLKGSETQFLPFNQGRDGGAGNPLNPKGYQTAYLWEKVWRKDNWLEILGHFMNVVEDQKRKPKALIFPRYHQWDVTKKLIEAARKEGTGSRYLIQHSAGSGKSNTIALTAHGLSELHNANRKVFDSVVIVTDRNVLDSQLRDTVLSFASAKSKANVAAITSDSAKTEQLVDALLLQNGVIILTLQTFPAFMDFLEVVQTKSEEELAEFFANKPGKKERSKRDIETLLALKERKFAIIADEAHSSQSGETANKLGEALGNKFEEGKDTEDVLLERMTTRATHPNISYFAFTATPKAATLQRFGRLPQPTKKPSDTNKPQAFHVYTMKQAIEEGFILDVLRNYSPYSALMELAQDDSLPDPEVDASQAAREVMKWVRIHPDNLALKCEIIVEHFRHNVAGLLGGKGKAMVVTSGRIDATRYKRLMDSHIKEKGYNIGTLVAFSGEVKDFKNKSDFHLPLQGVEADELGSFTEENMNPGVKSSELRTALKRDEFQILIVANKFQTGFDEPLLCGMYVDKELGGVNAVQTLSRLNRTYPGKTKTYIVDFINNPSRIVLAFAPYYETATLSSNTKPSVIHNLRKLLDKSGIYTDLEVREFVEMLFTPTHTQGDLLRLLAPAQDRFHEQWKQAETAAQTGDENPLKQLKEFRSGLGAFIKTYDFLSQVVDYKNTGLEKRNLFFRHLLPLLATIKAKDDIDLEGVELSLYALELHQENLNLPLGEVGEARINPVAVSSASGGLTAEKELRSIILERLSNTPEEEEETNDFLDSLRQSLLENPEIQAQAHSGSNSLEKFKNGSFKKALEDAVFDSSQVKPEYEELANQYFGDPKLQKELNDYIASQIYDALNPRHSLPLMGP